MAAQIRNWGAIITIGLALLACAVAWGATSATVMRHSEELVEMKQTDSAIADVLVKLDKNQALILQRLEALERRGN